MAAHTRENSSLEHGETLKTHKLMIARPRRKPTSILCMAAILVAICADRLGMLSSFVLRGRAAMYSSIRPPGNTPCKRGPNPRSDSSVNITDSVISASMARSPCICPYTRINTSLGPVFEPILSFSVSGSHIW